jgi:hypothetical protein
MLADQLMEAGLRRDGFTLEFGVLGLLRGADIISWYVQCKPPDNTTWMMLLLTRQ